MADFRRWIRLLWQSVVVGLALAFIVVFVRPDLLPRNGAADTYSPAVTRSAPAVVNIHSARLDYSPGGLREGARRREGHLGSGVIVREDGHILTSYHVIEQADTIRVTTRSGEEMPAKIVGVDPDTDIAVLKADLTEPSVIRMGRSDTVSVGDVVLAIGNPFGVGQTVTQGIVSATGRSQLGLTTFENFIQTDAAINRGNSGGALVNTRGELVGISTAFLTRSGDSNGIGFAVPVNLARGVMNEIIEHGQVIRGYLGIDPQQPFYPELAEALQVPPDTGILIRQVQPNSPADKAGLRQGDVIVEIDGERVDDERDALTRVARLKPGTRVDLTIIRRGERQTVEVEIGERPVYQAP